MEKYKTNNWFPVMVWLLTVVVIGPIFSSIIMNFMNITVIQEMRDFHPTLLSYIEIGFLFSLPVFAIYFVIFKILTYKGKSSFLIRNYLNIICTLGVFITFYIMSASKTNIFFSLVYSVSAILSGFIFKVYKTTPV
jgi:hypothetical protein